MFFECDIFAHNMSKPEVVLGGLRRRNANMLKEARWRVEHPEEAFVIEVANIWEAYDKMGIPFDETDASESARRWLREEPAFIPV